MSTYTQSPRSNETTSADGRGSRIALTIGFLALAGAVLVAYAAPADGYEASLYTATPLPFWLGVVTTLLVAVPVVIYSPQGYVSTAGTLLAGGAVVAIAALPIVRTYYFYGTGDALTHLGWTQDLLDGTLSAFGLFYPGIHTYSVFTKQVLGIGLPRAMLLVVLSILVAYVVFVPLCVRSMTTQRGAVTIGVLAGLLILPINHLGMNYMSAHPITDAVLLTPVVLYLLINYFTSHTDGFESRYPVSSVGILLAITLGSVVLYHPQQAANLIIFFVTISSVQFGYRLFFPASRVTEHQPLYGQTVFLVGAFMLWSIGRGRYQNSVNAVAREMTSFLTGAAGAGGAVGSRASSLAAVGSGLVEVFLKLFAVSAVFGALAGLLMLTSLGGRLRDSPDTDAIVKYFTIGLVVLIPYSLVFFVGSISKLFFRNLGLIVTFGTVLGTIALYRYVSSLSEFVSADRVRLVLSVAFVAMLALSLAVLFPSPYVYQPNEQVSEATVEGFSTTFEHRAPGIQMYGVREGPWRFQQGLRGVQGTRTEKIGRAIFGENITEQFPENRYFAVTGEDPVRETLVYDSLRYSRQNFTALGARPGTHRIGANGGLTLYLFPGTNATAAANSTTPTGSASASASAATPTPGNDAGSSAPGTATATTTSPAGAGPTDEASRTGTETGTTASIFPDTEASVATAGPAPGGSAGPPATDPPTSEPIFPDTDVPPPADSARRDGNGGDSGGGGDDGESNGGDEGGDEDGGGVSGSAAVEPAAG
jgi:uncharacterized membrane protein YgcG